MNKAFPRVPGGDVVIETPDATVKTYGDVVRNGLTDADWVNSHGTAYGAFPRDNDMPWAVDGQPTMRKPVNE